MSRVVLALASLAVTGACSASTDAPTDESAAGSSGLRGISGAIGTGGATPGGAGSGGAAAGGAGPARGFTGAHADRVARASAVVGSCLQDDGINRNNENMWYADESTRLWRRFAQQADCLASHGGGCGAVEACLGWSASPANAGCVNGCDGDVLRGCGFGAYDVEVDCSRVGLTCNEQLACADGPSEPCDYDTFDRHCAGDTPVFCDDDAVLSGPNCQALGLTCVDGACTGAGAECPREVSHEGTVAYAGLTCEGDTLVACVAGREHRLDCATVGDGFSCRERDGFHFCGLAAECVPALDDRTYGDDERCEGTTVVFCNAGRVERLDCTALGFDGCDVTSAYGCVPRLY